MSAPASPLGVGPLLVVAVGYTKGTTSSYAGLTVKSTSGNPGYPVSQLFNTGSLAGDLAAVMVATRFAGTQNLQSGGGLTFDQTVDNALIDFAAAATTLPSISSGSGVPSSTPVKGSIYLRSGGGTGLGTNLYVYDGAVWTAVTGV
jgi:hypothetical protein